MNTSRTTTAPRSFSGTPKPELGTFTVTIYEPGRLTPTEPWTYVLHAADLEAARGIALHHHIRLNDLDRDWDTGQPIANPDAQIVEGPANTYIGMPPWPADTAGRTWSDLRADPVALAMAGDVSAIAAEWRPRTRQEGETRP
ncbi:hypothetical protein ABH935_007036 [Catenulispora sp. GAS73]|uniref:hypothetical protein n=1 Tax=Catenulispora sp. GAS73 TaxID=3156269 RepID=UPI003518F760